MRDEIAMAGLEKAHVEQFESLGFERGKVVHPPASSLLLLMPVLPLAEPHPVSRLETVIVIICKSRSRATFSTADSVIARYG